MHNNLDEVSMNPFLISLLLIVGLGLFGRTIYHKIQLLMALESVHCVDHIKERFKNMVLNAMAIPGASGTITALIGPMVFPLKCWRMIPMLIIYSGWAVPVPLMIEARK